MHAVRARRMPRSMQQRRAVSAHLLRLQQSHDVCGGVRFGRAPHRVQRLGAHAAALLEVVILPRGDADPQVVRLQTKRKAGVPVSALLVNDRLKAGLQGVLLDCRMFAIRSGEAERRQGEGKEGKKEREHGEMRTVNW